jgi:hypothetical protein
MAGQQTLTMASASGSLGGKTIADFIRRPALVWHTVADVTYRGWNLR